MTGTLKATVTSYPHSGAGAMFTTLQRTREGLESHLAVNHIGHFYLLSLLLPKLQSQVCMRILGISIGP